MQTSYQTAQILSQVEQLDDEHRSQIRKMVFDKIENNMAANAWLNKFDGAMICLPEWLDSVEQMTSFVREIADR